MHLLSNSRSSKELSYTTAEALETIIQTRRTTSPRRMTSPGPNETQLRNLMLAALAAPDHGNLTPWRFVEVQPDDRQSLAELFVKIRSAQDPDAKAEDLQRSREKAYRAPTLLLAIARFTHTSDLVSKEEVLVSLGCAIQNMLLSATAAGFATALTSGRSLKSPEFAHFFGLSDHEQPICFVNIGTASEVGTPRIRKTDLTNQYSTTAQLRSRSFPLASLPEEQIYATI
jgi:nitroreductase